MVIWLATRNSLATKGAAARSQLNPRQHASKVAATLRQHASFDSRLFAAGCWLASISQFNSVSSCASHSPPPSFSSGSTPSRIWQLFLAVLYCMQCSYYVNSSVASGRFDCSRLTRAPPGGFELPDEKVVERGHSSLTRLHHNLLTRKLPVIGIMPKIINHTFLFHSSIIF